ncbi:hypothetical protein D3C84_888460 [compost metagenome]
MHAGQPQVAGRGRVGHAQQVEQGQQEQAAEQGAEQVGRLFLGDQVGLVDHLEPHHQGVVGGHADIDFARLAVVGQGEQVGPRGQWAAVLRQRLAGLTLLFQLAIA